MLRSQTKSRYGQDIVLELCGCMAIILKTNILAHRNDSPGCRSLQEIAQKACVEISQMIVELG